MRGIAHKFGDDVNTDLIFPAKYMGERGNLKEHAMEGIDPGFARKAKPGDFVVGGKNFGCGSSREEAVLCLKGMGAIIATSFSHIFYRNGINQGILMCEADTGLINDGDVLELRKWAIKSTGVEIPVKPLHPLLMEIVEDAGLIPHLMKRFG